MTEKLWKMVQNMKCDKSILRLYAVTDRSWLNGETLETQIEKSLKGGITCLQLREKNMSDDEFLNEAIKIKQLCKKYSVPFIINDNIYVAKECKADGIHVGQNDMIASDVRKVLGNDIILGVSVQTVEQAVLAQQMGADYLGVGAVFSTSTKPDADSVSLKTLKDICKSVSIPVVAIGGITEDNLSQLKDSGICGVALVSAIFASKDIEYTCKKLYKTIGDVTL